MQSIINISKTVILALLTCSLLITWNGGNNEVTWKFTNIEDTGLSSPDYDDSSISNKPVNSESIWTSMSREFKLDHKTQSPAVQAEIHKILAEQGKFYSILQAAAPYIYYIHQQTVARGLPAELALIPVIESEYNANDHSKAGATGLWQLMSETAKELGVKVKSGYDGRRNVVASTKAALAYFKDLGNLFNGNWYLAIAAYNCGQGTIESAERHTGSKSFWDLKSLPRETKYYVPKLLAVAAIIKNPQKYGVQLPPVNNKPYFTEVKIQKPVTLAKVAQTSGISIHTLNKLNPDFSRKAADKKTDTLLVPLDKAHTVNVRVAAVNTNIQVKSSKV